MTPTAESQFVTRGFVMKKKPARFDFWTWMLGGGWCGGGAHG
jgi:hypothetical protein